MNDKIFEVNDEVEQAYRQGFIAGTKFEAAKEMAELTKCLIKGVTKAVTQTINAVDYDAVYSAYKAQETEDKHWNECRQISEYDQENKAMKELLREAMPVLRAAFFAHFEDTNKANDLYDKIAAIVGKEE